MTSTSTPCFPGACNADAWLEAMRAGTQLAAALVTRDGREITFTLALDGFTKAADMHP
jgi:invasion protein IalB